MCSLLSECKLLGIRICIKRPTRGGGEVDLALLEHLAPSFLQRFSHCSCRAHRREMRLVPTYLTSLACSSVRPRRMGMVGEASSRGLEGSSLAAVGMTERLDIDWKVPKSNALAMVRPLPLRAFD
jgi:hypothetical protein